MGKNRAKRKRPVSNPRGVEKHVGRCPVTGKAQYVAKKHAKRIESQYRAGNSVFLCIHCDYYHLGHQGDRDRSWHRARQEAIATTTKD